MMLHTRKGIVSLLRVVNRSRSLSTGTDVCLSIIKFNDHNEQFNHYQLGTENVVRVLCMASGMTDPS